MIPRIDYKLCMACRVCITACPFGCLEADKTGIDRYAKVYPVLADQAACTGCGICASACPVDVIEMVTRADEG